MTTWTYTASTIMSANYNLVQMWHEVVPMIRVDRQKVCPSRVVNTELPRDVYVVCRTADQINLPAQAPESKRCRTRLVRKYNFCERMSNQYHQHYTAQIEI